MGDDEVLVLFASGALVATVGLRWYRTLLRSALTPAKATATTRVILGILPVFLLAALHVKLRVGAAREVREHGEYLLLFETLGAAWLVGLGWASGWLGIHVRDDAIERRNLAAAIATSGTLTGGMIVYAAANLGEGDTIETTIGPALLATASVLALWGAHQALSRATDAITIDRDLASGIRFAGMAIGTSLVVGHGVAGDYLSAGGTVRDVLARGARAIPLAGLAVVAQLSLRPRKEHPEPNALTRGLAPALVYVGIGVAIVRCLASGRSVGANQ